MRGWGVVAAACAVVAGEAAARDGGFVIVAPRSFHGALAPFVTHKEGRLPTRLVALEEALSGPGADDPEKLKRFLDGQRRAEGTRYVLLVGDADALPVRYMVLDRVTAEAFDYAFYPSDLYYADVAKADGSFDDWNGNKEGFHAAYFGEVRGEKNKSDPINFDGIDYKPELAVGRWPVSTEDEVRIVVEKTIRYERGVRSVPRAVFVATGGWVENRPAMDGFAAKLPKGWMVEKRYWVGNGRNDKTPPPNAASVMELLNGGVSLIVHSGHGSDDHWDGSIGERQIPELSNAERLPVLFSAGCSTARFATLPPYEAYVDVEGKEHAGTNAKEVFTAPPPAPACYQRGKYNPRGFGEQMLRAGPNGAVAYIGCNTGSQPCGMALAEGFVAAVGKGGEGGSRLGDCWAAAVGAYYDSQGLATLKPNEDWYPPSVFFQGMKFMLFGDPTIVIPGSVAGGAGDSQK